MSRIFPYRIKPPDYIKDRINETLECKMYLVNSPGPTSYVIKEQNDDTKYKVSVGALHTCSCGDQDLCRHILFVLLKIFRIPPANPLSWQKSYIDSEITHAINGDYEAKNNSSNRSQFAFLKRRNEAASHALKNSTSPENQEEEAVTRHELIDGEICAICQEEMLPEQHLTYCRKGCGNNFHLDCMKIYGESKKQSRENIVCPLCRKDWGTCALTELRREVNKVDHKYHDGIKCKKCGLCPIKNSRYRCLQCVNVDLCERCFKIPVHEKHPFIVKQFSDSSWSPAFRKQQTILTEAQISQIQSRELFNDDYELLLQLDKTPNGSLQEYLVSFVTGKLGIGNIGCMVQKTSLITGACSICKKKLSLDVHSYLLKCKHAVHESCLLQHLLSGNYSCPEIECKYILVNGLYYEKKEKRKQEKMNQQVDLIIKKRHDTKSLSILKKDNQVPNMLICNSYIHTSNDDVKTFPSIKGSNNIVKQSSHIYIKNIMKPHSRQDKPEKAVKDLQSLILNCNQQELCEERMIQAKGNRNISIEKEKIKTHNSNLKIEEIRKRRSMNTEKLNLEPIIMYAKISS